MEEAASFQEARRLHPSTLVQRFVRTLPAFLLLTLPFWTGAARRPTTALIIALMYGLLAVPLIVARYLRFRYWITPRELVIHSGVFTRQRRSIPIERIQNIEIRQPPMARLFRTAAVQVETAGSTAVEGSIEFVTLQEAQNIRRIVREYQRQMPEAAALAPEQAPRPDTAGSAGVVVEEEQRVLAQLPASRVLLSGMYRFSLLYILIIFSGIQYLDMEPEQIIDWFTGGRLEPVTDLFAASPLLATLLAAVIAALFSWLVGILVNFNRFYGFRLSREADKLHRRHGLMTVLEGTIPLKKIQAVIFRANALMRRNGWAGLHVQTMGMDADQQGHQVAVPFARREELLAITPEVVPFGLPDTFESVSRLTIRRMTIRYTATLAVVAGAGSLLWFDALYLLLGWPLLPLLAWLQYRNHGFAFNGDFLFVRRGVFVHHVWVLPVERFQALFSSATFFQRRLGLATVYVDTAGAATVRTPEVVDLPTAQADQLLQILHEVSGRRAGLDRPEPLPF